MIGLILDTNVLVSANLNRDGLEALVVSLALNRKVQLYVSEPILAEYEQVLLYPRLKFRPEAAGADFLVTGNKRHFLRRWEKTQIVNARELMGMIGPSVLK